MITFKINEEKQEIPTSWDDVTYSQYIQLLDVPGTLLHYVSFFTGIKYETLEQAELKNLESLAIALSFLSKAPTFNGKPSKMVGPYAAPKDITIQSLGQFEDLRALLNKVPTDLSTKENQVLIGDLYLEACAIYCQKIKYSKYDNTQVPELKEELKNYSCMEVISTGAFFLFRPMTILHNTTPRSQNIRQRLKKMLRDFPGYQKTLDSLLHSSTHPKP
jgi:hypothetical protein